MSADVLREAAAKMRERAQDCGGLASGWQPALALAAADWLTECAEHLEVDPTEYADGSVCLTAQAGPECSVMEQALAVARAYLGETDE